MRRSIVLLIVLVVLGSTVWLVVRRVNRPTPTKIGWRAELTVIAGNGAPVFRDSPRGVDAGFADPFGVAIGPDGTIYVADAGDSNRIRKVAADGSVSTLAGDGEGFADGAGANAQFNSPSGLALDTAGNIYVADTGNNRIRKITPDGIVTTVAGDGTAGYQDGPADRARFDSPLGLAIDSQNNIYVADTYNDRIRRIAPDSTVSTVAGGGRPGYQDGDAANALFDTPSAVAVMTDARLVVADSGNNRVRVIGPDRQVTTLPIAFDPNVSSADLRKPVSIVQTHDGFLYVTEFDRGRVVQIGPDGTARVIAGGRNNADGEARARFKQPAGICIDKRGDLYLADSGNYLIRKLSQTPAGGNTDSLVNGPVPRLSKEILGAQNIPWPFDPQTKPHEVAATMGEVRGSFDSTDSRDHLHSGIDIFAGYGDVVRALRSEKVTSPIANWGFDDLSEGIRIGVVSYIHIRLGRDKDGNPFNDPRLTPVLGENHKPTRMRVRRGARFNPGDAIGTVNRMYHVHLNVGPPNGEVNPLSLSPIGFSDRVPPKIERDGIQMFDGAGNRLIEKREGRLTVHGRISIVVDAFDRTDMNADRRRLGLYRLGYQILKADGRPAPGFEQPRMTIEFNRLPPNDDATKIAYADSSGITVYGSKTTRFLYNVTNVVRDGEASIGFWNASELAPGDYILRIIAADYSGNEAVDNRDVPVRVIAP